MANEDSPQLLRKGSIVEIIASSDEKLKGCRGEVVQEDPLMIAVVQILSFDANQVTNVFDATDWTKAAVCEEAERLGVNVRAKDTQADLVDKIKELHKQQRQAALEAEREAVTPLAVEESSLSIGPPTFSPRGASSAPTSDEIAKDDCVIILALKGQPNGRVCKVDKDLKEYEVAYFNADNKKWVGVFIEEQLKKLQSCPTNKDDAPPACS